MPPTFLKSFTTSLLKSAALCLMYFLFTSQSFSLMLTFLCIPELIFMRTGIPHISYIITDVTNRICLLMGLVLCGPVRTFAIVNALTVPVVSQLTLETSMEATKRRKGTILVLLSFILLAWFDYDEHPNSKTTSVRHAVHHLFRHFGMSDHKTGLFCLVVYVLTLPRKDNSTANWFGSMLLFAVSLIYSVATVKSVGSLPALCISTCSGLVFFYTSPVQKLISNKMVFNFAAYCTSILITVFAQKLWFPMQKHPFTIGAGMALTILSIGLNFLTSVKIDGYRALLGYTDKGLPLYADASETIAGCQDISDDFKRVVKTMLNQVLKHGDSRRIFYFLCLNLSFTFVEMSYGWWTNSLGLLSDGFHMLFDCTALILGLYASLISKKRPDKMFTYGYGRAEVLAGYVNGLFLLIVGVFVLVEAVSRLFHPPEIKSERLLFVSVLGLIINLTGVYSLGHLHAHGCHSHCSHEKQHGHCGMHNGHHSGEKCHGSHHISMSEHCTTHKSESHSHSTSQNANMRGVFLHILADTLGSVGVILSSLLIDQFGWYIADPICSLFIAAMIIISVFPMLWEAAETLCLRVPRSREKAFFACINKICHLPGVIGCKDYTLWTLSSKETVGSIHVLVNKNEVPNFDRTIVDEIVAHYLPTENVYVQIVLCDEHTQSARYCLQKHVYY